MFCNLITNQQLDTRLAKFWENEQCPERVNRTAEEKFCEDHFVMTCHRDMSSRWRGPIRRLTPLQERHDRATW